MFDLNIFHSEYRNSKHIKDFQILKIWKVPNSRKAINGYNKGIQDILSWYIINVWQGRYTWSVLIKMYIMYNDI